MYSLVGFSGTDFQNSGKEPEILYVDADFVSSGGLERSVCLSIFSGISLVEFCCTIEYQPPVCRDPTDKDGLLLE